MKLFDVVLISFRDEAGRILLNQRQDAPEEAWEFTGGGIETGESPRQALQREVEEELGYILTAHDQVQFVKKLALSDENFSATVHFFTARFPGLEHFSDSDEVLVRDLGLFAIEEAMLLPLLPMTRAILEDMSKEAV